MAKVVRRTRTRKIQKVSYTVSDVWQVGVNLGGKYRSLVIRGRNKQVTLKFIPVDYSAFAYLFKAGLLDIPRTTSATKKAKKRAPKKRKAKK